MQLLFGLEPPLFSREDTWWSLGASSVPLGRSSHTYRTAEQFLEHEERENLISLRMP